MLQIVHYLEDIYHTVSSFVQWNSVSVNPGQKNLGHLLYMLPSLYYQCVLLFLCLFRAPLSPRQCWNMRATNERILISEAVKNHMVMGAGGIVPTVLTRIVATFAFPSKMR